MTHTIHISSMLGLVSFFSINHQLIGTIYISEYWPVAPVLAVEEGRMLGYEGERGERLMNAPF